MQKAYINISAVANMTGQKMPEDWRVFQGTAEEFAHIKELLQGGIGGGVDAYKDIALTQFSGDMQKAYQNISAVANMTGQKMPTGWQAFRGSVRELREQTDDISTRTDFEAYKRAFYPSAEHAFRARANYNAIRNMQAWQAANEAAEA